MLDLGIDKLALIGAVALVVIGPERLPRVARTVGTSDGQGAAIRRRREGRGQPLDRARGAQEDEGPSSRTRPATSSTRSSQRDQQDPPTTCSRAGSRQTPPSATRRDGRHRLRRRHRAVACRRAAAAIAGHHEEDWMPEARIVHRSPYKNRNGVRGKVQSGRRSQWFRQAAWHAVSRRRGANRFAWLECPESPRFRLHPHFRFPSSAGPCRSSCHDPRPQRHR